MQQNTPHIALGAAVVLVVAGIAAALLADDQDSLTAIIGLIVASVPALLAAAFAERASRDIRNGTVTEKARQGSETALLESGVVKAVENARETTPAVLKALTNATDALNHILHEKETEGVNKGDGRPTL